MAKRLPTNGQSEVSDSAASSVIYIADGDHVNNSPEKQGKMM